MSPPQRSMSPPKLLHRQSSSIIVHMDILRGSLVTTPSHPHEKISLTRTHACTHTHTHTLCPWKVRTGLSTPNLHTWMSLSVEQEAKQTLVCQSTSSVAALWKQYCCFTSPVPTSHTMAVLSTPPVTIKVPLLFHLRAKMGPEWWTRVVLSVPSTVQSRATPSYEPVARRLPSD